MLAGAGSGKTTSLVKALDHVVTRHGARLKARTQQVACITYTEIAAEEIHTDVGNSSLLAVSTIHSFLWSLAGPFQADIANGYRARLDAKIQAIVEKQAGYTPRTRQPTIAKDGTDLERYRTQLGQLNKVDRYRYGATGGSEYAKGTLGHEDVIAMVPQLILNRPLMAKIVASKYPYIFVDESQDTFSNIVEALKHVSAQAEGKVCLGFFGDPMQQIYQRGIGTISLEPGWQTIRKPENFRSSDKVLDVINQVRAKADGLVQVSGRLPAKRLKGEAFFFVLPIDGQRTERLDLVRNWLDTHSNAGSWTADSSNDVDGAKILMIEHRMAAKRLGFGQLYAAFNDNKSSSLKMAFDEGKAWPMRPFESLIMPICSAESADAPQVISALRENGGILSPSVVGANIREHMIATRDAVERIRSTVEAAGPGSVQAALRLAVEAKLFESDPRLSAYLDPSGEHADVVLSSTTVDTMDAFMACDVAEIPGYFKYIRQESPYSTQHGTKGAEFRKVIVVLDDDEGRRSTLYSYEKLFGITSLSATDQAHLTAGEESVLERTRRLLYVCVSRAVESLAIVFFARDVMAAKSALEESGLLDGGTLLTQADLIPA